MFTETLLLSPIPTIFHLDSLRPIGIYPCTVAHHAFFCYRGQPKAGTGHKMLFVPFIFSMSRFQGPSFCCNRIVVIVTWGNRRHSRQYKDYNFWRNENFHNLYERLLHERKLKSGYLERRIYQRPLHLRVSLLSRMKPNILQNYLYINLL